MKKFSYFWMYAESIPLENVTQKNGLNENNNKNHRRYLFVTHWHTDGQCSGCSADRQKEGNQRRQAIR